MHKNIKPDNVLLYEDYTLGYTCKLADSGHFAHMDTGYVTHFTTPIECLLGQEYTPASDVW